jgi:hypothetical protein
METTQERIFFQDSRVIVTQSRFVADGKTYAMRNIASVTNFKIKKSRTLPVIITSIGVLFLFDDNTRNYGLLMAGIGGLWWYLIKDEFSVRINSNSGESDGFISKDRDYIQQIVDAVNNAIVFRG